MSYAKKDEDADQTMVKLDRTSVFQDGTIRHPLRCRTTALVDLLSSTSLQQLADLPSKMPYPPYQNHSTPLHGRKVSDKRSYISFFWHIQAVPEQRCIFTANGVFSYQRAGKYGGRCHYGH